MMVGGQYSLVGLCPVWAGFQLFVVVAFSSLVPQNHLFPPEIIYVKKNKKNIYMQYYMQQSNIFWGFI